MPRVGVVVAALLLFVPAIGCNRQDADTLVRVSGTISQKIEAIIPEKTPFGSTWTVSVDSSTVGKVRFRLQHDKQLANQTIEVTDTAAGVRLRGKLETDTQKQRALELTENTIGVEKCIDELEVVK